MSNVTFDIDIDMPDRSKILDIIEHIPAGIIKNDVLTKHNTGVYLHEIPTHPITGVSTIDYKEAEDRGYFKVDFLNNSVYADVRDNDHLDELINTEPMWELLEHEEFVKELPHMANHFDIVKVIKPQSVEDLAVVLALIRPGKRHLLEKDRKEIDNNIWNINEEDSYTFKKSHAISYAVTIVVKMNLLSGV